MLRHVLAVILSALFGSTLSTLLLIAWSGGTGAEDPIGFFVGFTLATLIFTIPGCVLLMYLTLSLAEAGWARRKTMTLLLFAGPIGGAAMSMLFGTLVALSLDAFYGVVTAATFVAALHLLRCYPARTT